MLSIGTIWIILILLFIGRKKAIALTGLMAAASYGLLFLCLGQYVTMYILFILNAGFDENYG